MPEFNVFSAIFTIAMAIGGFWAKDVYNRLRTLEDSHARIDERLKHIQDDVSDIRNYVYKRQ